MNSGGIIRHGASTLVDQCGISEIGIVYVVPSILHMPYKENILEVC